MIGIVEKVDVSIGEWSGKVDFKTMQIDDYEILRGMEFMKQFEAMMVPHLKNLYIYDRLDDDPIGVPTIGAMTTKCKLTTMNVEEVKRDEEEYKSFSCTEEKLMEQSQVIRALSDSILDLSSRLEVVEKDGDAKPDIQMEIQEAYMQRLEEEYP